MSICSWAALALVVVTRAMHWFNPLIHFLSKEISLQCELSCDMEVIEGLDFDTRLSYCKTIISMAGGQKEIHTPLATNFNGGKNMKKRLLGIMDPGKKKLSLVLVCGVCILTLGTGIAYASGIADDPILSKDNSSVLVNETTTQEKSDKANTAAETDSSKMSMVPATKETVEEQTTPKLVPTTTLEMPAEEADRLAAEEAMEAAIEAAIEAVRLAEETVAPEWVPTTSLEVPAEEQNTSKQVSTMSLEQSVEEQNTSKPVPTTSLEEPARNQ